MNPAFRLPETPVLKAWAGGVQGGQADADPRGLGLNGGDGHRLEEHALAGEGEVGVLGPRVAADQHVACEAPLGVPDSVQLALGVVQGF